ncbi:MAG: Ig-like domain-containing protein, partial [Candidatus Binatia bacterium]
PAMSGPSSAFHQLTTIRRLRRRLIRGLFFASPRQYASKPGIAFTGAASLGKVSIDRDIVTLIVIVVTVAGTLWFGHRSRATMEGCSTNPVSAEFVPELNVAMTVKRGSACAVWARVATAFVETLTVESAPRHGTLRLRDLSGVIYRPDPGFAGSDAFAFERRGAAQHHKRNSLVRVEVNVE